MIPPGQALYIRKCRGKNSRGKLCPCLLITPKKLEERLEFLSNCRWYVGQKIDAEYQTTINAIGNVQFIKANKYKLWFCPACGLKVARSVRFDVKPIKEIIRKVRLGEIAVL